MADAVRRKMDKKERRLKQDAFLRQFQASGEIGPACVKVGMHRDTHYHWLKIDRDYAKRYAEAQAMRVEVLETELRRRALVGWDEPVYYKGQQVGSVRKFSDTCLIFALKGEKPEKYREHYQHEITGKDGGPLRFTIQLGVGTDVDA